MCFCFLRLKMQAFISILNGVVLRVAVISISYMLLCAHFAIASSGTGVLLALLDLPSPLTIGSPPASDAGPPQLFPASAPEAPSVSEAIIPRFAIDRFQIEGNSIL